MSVRGKWYFILSYLILCVFNVSYAASLIGVVKGDKYEEYLSDAKAVTINNNGIIFVSSQTKGSILAIDGKTISHEVLVPKIFDDTDLAGISVFNDNKFVIINNDDSQIAITDSNFNKIKLFSKSGDDAGELDSPNGVATSINNRIYVADTDNDRISVFNSQGLYLFSFGDSGSNLSQLSKPTHIALDALENVYVLESREKNRLSVFNRQGALLKQINANELALEFGSVPDFSAMTVDLNGLIYFADEDQRKVTSLNWENNTIMDSFGSFGESSRQFRFIADLSINNKSQIVVLDTGNEKVEWFQLAATEYDKPKKTDVIHYQDNVKVKCAQVYAFKNKQSLCVKYNDAGIVILSKDGQEQGSFSDIKDPTHIHAGNTHVAITEGNSVSAFTYDNKKLFKIGRYGISPGGFDGAGFVFAINNKTYVSDKNNNRIQVFDKGGLFSKLYNGSDSKNSPFEYVGQFVVSNDGKLYVADQNERGQIIVSDVETGHRESIITLGEDPYNVRKVYSLGIDKQNRLYIFSATSENPFTVSIWKQGKELIRFGSEQGNAITQALYEPSNMSVSSSLTNTILINDNETSLLHTYQYQEIPEAAFALQVDANNKEVKLKWSKPSSQLIAQFIIEGAKNKKGPYHEITKTSDNIKTFKTSDLKDYVWFRIVSLSGLGLKAKASKVMQNSFKQIAQLFKSKQYHQVIVSSEKLLKRFPNNADLLYLYARSLFLNNNFRDAIPVFNKLTQYKKYKNKALKAQVEAYFLLEEYISAKSLIDEVLASKPKEPLPYIICTELSLMLGDAIGAVSCAEDGLDLHSDHVKLRYLLGKSYISAGIPEEGLIAFETIVKKYPDDFQIRLLIANDLYELGLYEKALQHFSFVVSRQSFSTKAKNGKAKTLIALERYDEAKTLAITLSGNKQSKLIQSDGYYLLGQIAFSKRQFTQAVLRLTRAGKYNSKAIKAWSLLAQSYIKINKLAKSVTVLNQGINKNPKAFELYVTLGKIELEQEHYPEAIKALQKAVDLTPTSLNAQKLLAKSLFIVRDFRKAATHAAQALRISPKDIDVLSLQADISSRQGKVGSAIEYLKTAISIKPSSADLQYRLGKIYQHANVFDSSKRHLEKSAALNPSWADPHSALGNLYLKRHLYGKAILAYEKAIQLDPSDNNRAALNVAFASQKKALEFSNNAPQLVLQDLNIRNVFSAAYKNYIGKPIGQVTLNNVAAADYGDLTLSFQIKEYMDFPAIQKIPIIKGFSKQVLDIKAIFNNKILEVDQDTGVQVEVKLSYLRDGQKDDIALTQAMTIYGKNAMVWNDSAMIGSFVTPKDDTLRNFVREVVSKYQPKPGPVNEKLVSAMAYFSSLNAHGTKYIIDPNTPYASLRKDQVDYVQFPRETLRLKSGDCDDLSVLYSAGLENLGINTALLEVPGHLLMMFDTGLNINDASLVSRDLSLLAVKNNRIWIPIETTMINNSFSEAWAEGARKYQKAIAENNLGVILMNSAWQKYKPATLVKTGYKINLPNEELTKKLVLRESKVLLTKSIDRLILPYQAMVASDPSNILARMQIAILYSRFGLYADATLAYEALTEIAPKNISVLNNKGNLLLLQNRVDDALKEYSKAENIDINDAYVKLNIAMAYYTKGNVKTASAYFKKALSLDASLKQKYNAFGKLLSY